MYTRNPTGLRVSAFNLTSDLSSEEFIESLKNGE